MGSRQRSASSLSHHSAAPSSSSSPGGIGTGAHYLHDPDDIALSDIPSFQGNSLPIPTFGTGSPYPTMSSSYAAPQQGPSATTRPRAHTSADSSPANVAGAAFGGHQPLRQPSRNSLVPTHQPGGIGVRHVSTPVQLDSSRMGGVVAGGGAPTVTAAPAPAAATGSGGGGIFDGSSSNNSGSGAPGAAAGAGATSFLPCSTPQNNLISIPPPPPPPAKDYRPHYATLSRSHGRESMDPRATAMHYTYIQQPQHHPQQQHYALYNTHQPSMPPPSSQLPPLSVPHHSGSSSHYASLQSIHPQRPQPEIPMYRHPSAQSTESVTSFPRTDSTSETEYTIPSVTAHAATSVAPSRNGQLQQHQQQQPSLPHHHNSAGITRSPHVPPSQQSPLGASNGSGPLPDDVATVWTLESVLKYLERHEFSAEWQQAFHNLNIHGREFLEMGQHHSPSLFQTVLPEVERLCGSNVDILKEKQAARNLKKMVREMLKLSRDIPNSPPSSGPAPQTPGEDRDSPGRPPASMTASVKSPNQRRLSSRSTMPVYSESSEIYQHRATGSESTPRLRSDFSKGALASVDQPQKRHSPSSSETNIREPQQNGYGKGSPHSSPSLGYQSISARHGKSNSTESVASSTMSRAGDGKGKEKALQVLGLTQKSEHPYDRAATRQDSHDYKPSGSNIVEKVKKKFRKDKDKGEPVYNEDDSPTSPGWRTASTFFSIAENNISDSSIDRISISSTDARGRVKNWRSVPAVTGNGLKSKSLLALVTKDEKWWKLVDLTNLDTVDAVRKEICSNLGISDYDNAAIHLTEIGVPHEEEVLTDQMLMLSCRHRADNFANLKFFVQPTPQSAFEPLPSPSFMGQGLSASPSQQSFISQPPRTLYTAKQVDRTRNPIERRSSSPHLSSESTTLTQNDYLLTREVLEKSSEPPQTTPPRNDLDELRQRLAVVRGYQDNKPEINIIPFSPNPPLPSSVPHPSVQPSPNEPLPDPNSAYPTYGSDRCESEFSGLKPHDLRVVSSNSPIEIGSSPAMRQNELFFEEDRSPVATFGALDPGSHKGSAGSNQLQAAAQSHRQREMEQQKKLRQAEQERHTGFSKIQPNRGGRVVDFDNPRPSPFEDVKMDNLIPQRKPPPPPVNRISTVNSLTKGNGWPTDSKGHGTFSQLHRKKSVDKRTPEMTERRERRKVTPLHTAEDRSYSSVPSPVSGIGSSLISAGIISAGITRTPIPGVRRDTVSTSATSSSSSHADSNHQYETLQRQRAMAAVNIENSGTNSPRSGGTPNSPRFTWGKGNQLFKIPDYETEAEPGPDKLTLQIPSNVQPQTSPEISPGDREITFGGSDTALDADVPFIESEIQFITSSNGGGTSQAPDDSDEDEGLFAIPISSRGDKPKVDFAKEEKAENAQRISDSPRPTLTIATKNVTFRSTPTTSATVSGSATTTHSPPSPEFEEGDDLRALHPFSHNISTPGSAHGAFSPAGFSSDLNRRNSFARADNWASRPPAEALINNLDDFFPNLDLDQPIIDEEASSPPPSPSPATEYKPQSYQLSDPPVVLDNPPPPPSSDAGKMASEAAVVGTMGPPPAPTKQKHAATQRNVSRLQLGRMKSIREVAKGAHENRKRFTQPNTGEAKSGDILRRKSTKLFGARLIEVTPGHGKKGHLQQQHQLHQPLQAQQGGIKRQATFKWFKGQLIGKGTYGRVYLGMNATTGEFLAVKQVEVSAVAGDSDRQKEMIAALNQEIETMQHLDHVNIVQYLGCEKKEMSMSIFLEYIPGGSVGSCLRKHGRFEEPVVRSLTRQTLSGLEYLHFQGILHRDLKADNILLDLDGTCKISDFGISKKSDNIYGDDPGNSMQGSVFWMAPEVIRPEGQGYSAKIDIWSLGCVVLEMFAGRRPWSKEEAIGAIYKLGSERQAPPIPEDVSEVISPSAIGFLADCHTIEPSERPTAATLLEQHEFCSLDPNFNFFDTSLYQKIRPAQQP